MKLRHELALLLLLLLIAAPSRLLALDVVPPGLFHDEAYEGIDAWRILNGARPVFLPENYGREPLYAYLMAPLIGLAGPTPVAVRATSALLGLLAIPAAYLWGRVLFGSGIGLLTAALTAASYWVLHESRLGMRPIALPAFLALGSALVWLGARHGRFWAWPLAGLALGLGLYTYLPARLFPLVALGQALVGLWAGRGARGELRRGLAGLVVLGLVTILVAWPLLEHFRRNPDDVGARTGVVSILATDAAQAEPAAALARNLALNLGMFVWRGDDAARHNLPDRPVFDGLIAPFFLFGVALSLARLRRPEHAALWIWLIPMSLPGLLSDSAPHFLRSIGLLPALFALPAFGLLAATGWLARRLARPTPTLAPAGLPLGLLAGILVGSQLLAWRDYFVELPRRPELALQFDQERARLAQVAGDPPPGTRLDLPTPGWSYATIRFLRPREFEPPDLPPNRLVQARFDSHVVLLGFALQPDPPRPGQPARLTLYWRPLRELNASYVETVRLVDGYGRVWWQRSGVPGSGTLPTDTWMPSEIVADHLPLELEPGTPTGTYRLEVTLAQPDGGRRLPVLGAEGRRAGNSLRLEGLLVQR
jgi:4-amino-4-deoxy-L-arabinose transferase-like glycosyltransferase